LATTVLNLVRMARRFTLALALLASGVTMVGQVRAQLVEWTQRVPIARGYAAMTYDSARGVTVMFGGYSSPGLHSGETWEWDGTTWNYRAIDGPSPRYGHAMAYDSARHVTVLFGGYTNTGPYYNGETWEWDGTTWTQRAGSGPSPREHHAMAYDAARGVTVLFGGDGLNGYSNETWEWNGVTWTQRVVSGPSLRAGHANGMGRHGPNEWSAVLQGGPVTRWCTTRLAA
jgi:hypothetical protein